MSYATVRIVLVMLILGMCGQINAAFERVINIPPEREPTTEVGSNTQINIFSAGFIGNNFRAGSRDESISNVEVNLLGGRIGQSSEIAYGATLNVYSGTVDGGMIAFDQTAVNIYGGYVEGFRSWPTAVVNLFAGEIGYGFAPHGLVNIEAGTIGDNFHPSGAYVNLRNGSIGDVGSIASSVLNITGGTIGYLFTADDASVINLSKGAIGDRFYAIEETVVNFSGGSIGDAFFLGSSAELNIFGKSFAVNGVPLNVAAGSPVVFANRNVVLSGVLWDGSAFSFPLSTDYDGNSYLFDFNARIRLSRNLPGDFNRDGGVNAADYTFWRDTFERDVPMGSGADGNFDGYVDEQDFDFWKINFGRTPSGNTSSNASVPEPTNLVPLLVTGLLGSMVTGAFRAVARS